MYHKILKGIHGDHKYLMCSDLWDNRYGVMPSENMFNKIDLECAETIKARPTKNY